MKLRLELDHLRVETFDTLPAAGPARGTVRGNADFMDAGAVAEPGDDGSSIYTNSCPYTAQPTCPNTCYASCPGTCYSCNPTQCGYTCPVQICDPPPPTYYRCDPYGTAAA